MSDDPIIGAVYEKKLERRAFSAAYHASLNAFDAWSRAMMADRPGDSEKARYQRVILLKAMDDAMRASGMDPSPGNYRKGEE